MRYRFLFLAFFGTLTAVAVPAFAQNPALAERGMKLYTDQKCSMCHSIAGKGNPKGILDDVGARLSADDLRHWLVNPQEMRDKAKHDRKPLMKSFTSLSKDDLDALVAYLQTLKKK